MQRDIPNIMESVKKLSKEEYLDYLKNKYDMNGTITENDRITKDTKDESHHIYTWERIYHFSCGNCKNWWSYATIEDSYKWKSRKMTCPHCGHYSTIQPNSNIMEIDNEKTME